MVTIAIVAFDGVTDLDVFLHWDLLNRPVTQIGAKRENWTVKLLGTSAMHTTEAGLQIAMHGTVVEARDADAVVHASGKRTQDLMSDHSYLRRLGLDPTRQYIASQCSGALVLGAAGVLDGLTVSTYPTAKPMLEKFRVHVLDEAFVPHDRVATAAGCLAGVQLSHWLLEKLAGREVADRCIDTAAPWGQGLERAFAHYR